MTPVEWITEHILWLASSFAIPIVFRLVVEPFLPTRIRETVGYHWKHIRKYCSVQNINLSLIMTAKLHTPESVPVEEFMERVQQGVRYGDHVPSIGADTVQFDVSVGRYARSTLQVMLDISSDDVGGELMADGIKIRIHHTCTLRNIDERLSELQSVSNLVAPLITQLGAELVKERCLECGVKEMAGVTIMLKAIQDTHMRVRVADGHDFELTKDKIRYYTEMFDTDLHRFLKRIIVAYT